MKWSRTNIILASFPDTDSALSQTKVYGLGSGLIHVWETEPMSIQLPVL